MTPWQHLKAALGTVFISANLLLVLVPLLLLLLFSLSCVVWPSLGKHFHHATYLLYRYAVWVNDWWLCSVMGVDWQPNSDKTLATPLELHPDRSYLVIANHQSWFDIYIVQSLILRSGPMVTFLVKRELIYVPIVGWIILALRFPLLKRLKAKQADAQDQKNDVDAIEKACEEVGRYPTALLNFVEGTRFTPAKHAQQQSPYRHLLKPRRTGFRSMVNALQHNIDGVVDISVRYPGSSSFWQCMGGVHKRIDCAMELQPCPAASDVEEWLDERWKKKDQML